MTFLIATAIFWFLFIANANNSLGFVFGWLMIIGTVFVLGPIGIIVGLVIYFGTLFFMPTPRVQ